jgi:iron(II)-dependent oxidoreductase
MHRCIQQQSNAAEVPTMLATQNDVITIGVLKERLRDARRRSDELFSLVKPDAVYERPIPERHRIIFYIGHLEAFDWNLLGERVFGLKSFHPSFDRLFAFGIDPVGGGLPDDQPSDWPIAERIHDYATKVRSVLDDKLDEGLLDSGLQEFSMSTLLNVAIEHRLMHAETLAYLLHQLPLNRKVIQKQPSSLSAAPVDPQMVEVPAGTTTLGQARSNENFGWDNEYEETKVDVPHFAIDRYKVTNRQYLDFVLAGGYDTRSFWTDEDWSWKAAHNISHPAFWRRDGNRWIYRGMFAEAPLPLDPPVYVSHAEAKAYAHWSDKQLPTEAEWHRAAYAAPDETEREYPWGNTEPSAKLGNFDSARWDPVPVTAFPHSDSPFGVADMVGNGWEWTSTPFAPFAGFQPFPFYRGYSADFFDGKHFVMKGGSSRTAACMLRRSFRNWFQSHYQYMYAGFRCVRR